MAAHGRESDMATYAKLIESIHTLFGVFHLHILIGGDVSRRRLVRVDVAGSRGRHAARLAWTRRVVVG